MSLVLNVEILGEFKKLTQATKGAETQLTRMNKVASSVSSKMSKALGAIGLSLSVYAIGNFTKEAIAAGEEAKVAQERLTEITKSMGIFGDETDKTVSRLSRFADKTEVLTAVSAETTKQVQATLMTFSELGKTANVVGGNFDRTTKAALDLAAAGFGTATTNAVQLGKALQDPVKGLTALARSGVTFTKEQKAINKALVEGGFANALVAMGYADTTKAIMDQVKAYEKEGKTVQDLVKSYTDEFTPAQLELFKKYEEGGNIVEAQANVLKAIEEQVGGTAEATVTATARMQVAFGQVQEAIGLALLPALEKVSDWLATEEGQDKLQSLIDLVGNLTGKLSLMVGFVIDNKDAIIALSGVIATITVGMKAYNAVQAITITRLGGVKTAAAAALGPLTAIIAAIQLIDPLAKNLQQGFSAAAPGTIPNLSGQSSAAIPSGVVGNMVLGKPKATTTAKALTAPKTGTTVNVNVKNVTDAKSIITTVKQFEKSTGTTLAKALR